MLAYAKQQGVKLMAYVYPTLAFQSAPEQQAGDAHGHHGTTDPWLYPHGCSGKGCNSDLSCPEFQVFLLEALSALYTQFELGGFAWDYGIGDTIKCGRHCDTRQINPNATDYAIWKGWMAVIGGLRERFPEIVMDHRVSSHSYGPWYQLAGSYAEPLSHDENPETYPIIVPSTHTDHVAADTMRSVNYWYRNQVLLPSERVPGFAFHQTERGAPAGPNVPAALCGDGEGGLTRCYRRDFDLLGYKYSLLSEVATAGLNHVLCLLPARDMEEFVHFPKADVDFIRKWLNFSDDNMAALRRTVPLPGLAVVTPGTVDGTAAFALPPSCAAGPSPSASTSQSKWAAPFWQGSDSSRERATFDPGPGFVFLFNPGYLSKNVTVVFDDRLSSYHPCLYAHNGTGTRGVAPQTVWVVEELYPIPRGLMTVSYGDAFEIVLAGSSATVLRLTVHAIHKAPVLLGATGTVSIDSGGELSVANLSGEPGSTCTLEVILPPGAPCSSVETQPGDSMDHRWCTGGGDDGAPARVALGRVTFAGAPFPHAKQVQLSCAPHPNESGSAADNNVTCTGHFNVPAAIAAQMAARAAAYPIAWGAEDQDASWLQPARLLLYLHMPAPNIAFPVSLSLNETAVPRLEAFETRVPRLWAV